MRQGGRDIDALLFVSANIFNSGDDNYTVSRFIGLLIINIYKRSFKLTAPKATINRNRGALGFGLGLSHSLANGV
jgi:hypothetical protein